jgi:hypothetical protein
MSISDTIHIAEGQIGDLQRTLGVVESALETADDVIVAGEKAGRRLVGILKVLLVVGIVVGVVMAVRAILARRSESDADVTLTIVEDVDGDEEPETSTAEGS